MLRKGRIKAFHGRKLLKMSQVLIRRLLAATDRLFMHIIPVGLLMAIFYWYWYVNSHHSSPSFPILC